MTLEDVVPADDDDLYDVDVEDDEDDAEPEPVAEQPAPAPEPQKPEQPTTVPLHVVAELRAERNLLREQRDQMMQLLQKLPQPQQPPGQPATDDLTPKQGEGDADYFARVINHLLTETQETRKEREERAKREEAVRGEQQYVEKVKSDYASFIQTEAPDLVEAGEFLAKPLMEHLAKIYPPEMIPAMVGEFERDLHRMADKAGVGYGKFLWDRALAAGYVPQAQRQKEEVAQQKRRSAESARGIGGASVSAGGMTQMEAAKIFHSGKSGRTQKIPELGNITVEEAFATGAVRRLRK